MDTGGFLDAVVAPGAFLALAYNSPTKGMLARFFPRADTSSAAGFLKWAAGKGMDTWYAVSSYQTAQQVGVDRRGQPKYLGKRLQTNVDKIQTFWIDLDVKRPGDKKAAGAVSATAQEAMAWLIGFVAATKLPKPNMIVKSGYGLHVYWCLEDPLTRAEWQPHADALKRALIDAKAPVDIGVIADSARILRPIGTVNLKVPEQPMPVMLMAPPRARVPNQTMFDALAPFRTAGASSPLDAGGPASVFAGRASTTTVVVQSHPPAYMAEIAKHCGQIAETLKTHGAGENYGLWYLGNLSLASFCEDGKGYVHPLSDGSDKYDKANTDAAFARIEQEKANKAFGPPSCAQFEQIRPDICHACPFWGKIRSPISLGYGNNGVLPAGYRRSNGMIQRSIVLKGEQDWVDLVSGDILEPMLSKAGPVDAIQFIYQNGKESYTVYATRADVLTDARHVAELFSGQGIKLQRQTIVPFGDMIVAFMDDVRLQQQRRRRQPKPFGWEVEGTQYLGVSVAGIYYKADGSVETAPGMGSDLAAWYTKCGSYEPWRRAADLVLEGRPDLQAIAAVSFGAPLMRFTGYPGVVFSGWSQGSGVGKTSAIKVAHTVWAKPSQMSALDDTSNASNGKLARTRIMPLFWDEMFVSKHRGASIVERFFSIAQGKEKARMGADTKLREVGEWRTILFAASNTSLVDIAIAERQNTDAGALRIFEFKITHPPIAYQAGAQEIIAACDDNYGHAGHRFIAWCATHADDVQRRIRAASDKIVRVCGDGGGERLLVAGFAAAYVGAEIATEQDVYKFDLPALWSFLATEFVRARERRGKTLESSNGILALGDVFGRFITDTADRRIVTNRFMNAGRATHGFEVLSAPSHTAGVAVHVAQKERIMRVDKRVLETWCRDNGVPASDFLEQIEVAWGTSVARGILGAGTSWATGRIRYVEIPIRTPELAGSLFLRDGQEEPQAPDNNVDASAA